MDSHYQLMVDLLVRVAHKVGLLILFLEPKVS